MPFYTKLYNQVERTLGWGSGAGFVYVDIQAMSFG